MEGKQRLKRALSAHQPRPIGDFRRYAVLIPLVYENGTPYLLFENGPADFPTRKPPFPAERSNLGNGRDGRCAGNPEELGLPENKIQVWAMESLITWHNMMIETVTGELRDFCASGCTQ